MAPRKLLLGLAGATAVGAVGTGVLVRRYQRDLLVAQARLDAVDRRSVTTPFGTVEYAEAGSGDPVLVSHGILHGCDGGLRSAGAVVDTHRVIAPSRFGYLGSPAPDEPSTALQADAFAALLDQLSIDAVDVLGISAGTGAAEQLALRHPDRVRHLVIASGNHPGSPTAQALPDWAQVSFSPGLLWGLRTFARPVFTQMMGVPDDLALDAADATTLDELMDSIFPVAPRFDGAVLDALRLDAEVNELPLEEITVPTMIVHAQDDPLASYDAAALAAERIPGAVLVPVETGGHFLLGQSERIRAAVEPFLASA